MLELKNIKKTYNIGGNETKALNDVSVAFREKEFVSILGMSGSGKTTFLNIIGGLDTSDSGELIIKGKQTKDFKTKDWDAYRNNSIGFIFQTYNLIMHMSIIANVEIGMTLSGVPSEERRKRALEVLERVGLKEHLHKKPNQLSGGQMQRVAIARALVNDPEILLCDEPTGALDTTTSEQIMDLIKELSSEKLVIVVTHNPDLAEKYSDRIIKFQDGQILTDSKPHIEKEKEDSFSLKKTSMNFFTALILSFNNIRTKKWRTFLTSFASSIGIIGIAVILSLSSGFQVAIDDFQRDTLAGFPILVSKTVYDVSVDDVAAMGMQGLNIAQGEAEENEAQIYDKKGSTFRHTNVIDEEYLNYVDNLDPQYVSSVGYIRAVGMNLLREVDGKVKKVSLGDNTEEESDSIDVVKGMMGFSGISVYPKGTTEEDNFLEKHYDVLAGEMPKKSTDLTLLLDNKKRLDIGLLRTLGFTIKEGENIEFDEIVGTQIKAIANDNFYKKTELGNYLPRDDYDEVYKTEGNLTLTITGIIMEKADSDLGVLGPGVCYSDDLLLEVIDMCKDSEIVKAQKESSENVMSKEKISGSTKEDLVSYLGGSEEPNMIMIYPRDFDSKAEVLKYLEDYNEGKPRSEQVIYNDMAGTMSSLTGGIMDAITVVLIAFSAISLVVSLIMISIITYTSVLERTKEIGILRSLGARKKDITRVFDAETFILGVFSGVLGITIAWLLTIPINSFLFKLTTIANIAQLRWQYALILLGVSVLLTVVGGHIPAKIASKKDAVEALRSE